MTEEFLIPGMYISRVDIKNILEKHLKLSEKEADGGASRLTDGQMEDIAWAFSSEFFDVRESLFHEILADAIDSVQRDYDMHKSLYEDA